MNGYELLLLNKNILQVMKDASLDIGDIKYLPMYQEYVRLMKEGHKKTYIVQYLSDEEVFRQVISGGFQTVPQLSYRTVPGRVCRKSVERGVSQTSGECTRFSERSDERTDGSPER